MPRPPSMDLRPPSAASAGARTEHTPSSTLSRTRVARGSQRSNQTVPRSRSSRLTGRNSVSLVCDRGDSSPGVPAKSGWPLSATGPPLTKTAPCSNLRWSHSIESARSRKRSGPRPSAERPASPWSRASSRSAFTSRLYSSRFTSSASATTASRRNVRAAACSSDSDWSVR